MKFNVEKLKAIARPMSLEGRATLRYRAENAYWLRLSLDIALKIRKILCNKGITIEEFANLMSVTEELIKELLSGEVNFDLKTIVRIQRALKELIFDINLSETQYDCQELKGDIGHQPDTLQRKGECSDIMKVENILNNRMEVNLEKFMAIAKPMSPEKRAEMEFRVDNADWLLLSSAISLKIRKILSHKGMSQTDLAVLMSVAEAELKDFLSGKVNLDLKTIAKFQSVLEEPIIEVDLIGKNENRERFGGEVDKQEEGKDQLLTNTPIVPIDPDPSLENIVESFMRDTYMIRI